MCLFQACQQERGKMSENFYVPYRGWQSQPSMSAGGLGGRCKPPIFLGILDVLRVNLRHLVKII